MKKTYIKPLIKSTRLELEGRLLDGSLRAYDKTVYDTKGGWVKEDNQARGTHSVWDDDWSK